MIEKYLPVSLTKCSQNSGQKSVQITKKGQSIAILVKIRRFSGGSIGSKTHCFSQD